MEVSITHVLLLGMLVVMATQIDGAKEKRKARELGIGGVIVEPPKTVIPEGQPPIECDGHPCGNGGTCEEFCLIGFPVRRSKKRAIADFIPGPNRNNCPRGCQCCNEDIVHSIAPPVKCNGSRCGDGGVCRPKVCSVYHGKEIPGECVGDCICCKEPVIDRTDCFFNGKKYESGERIEGVCVDVTCKDGQWISKGYIDRCCVKCNVEDDPHFITFDDVVYSFYGKCNYSITQYGTSYTPPYGVYGDFRSCGGSRSCVDETTFKDDEFTAILMTRYGKWNIEVNNVPFEVTHTIQRVMSSVYHPVLAWRIDHCIRFLGTQRLVVDYCWDNGPSWRQLYLFAHPALTDKLYGLCGYFNYCPKDDLTHRDGSISPPPPPHPNAFGNSWKTNFQNPDCPTGAHSSIGKRQAPSGDDPCPDEDYQKYLEICRDILSSVSYDGNYATPEQVDIYSMFCAGDLCALENSGHGNESLGYQLAVQEFLRQTIMRDVMTTCGARPPETCGGDCGSGGTCRLCSCQDDEEQIEGACNLKNCLCCKKKPVCTKCTWRGKTYPCVPPAECRRIINKGICPNPECACCKRKK